MIGASTRYVATSRAPAYRFASLPFFVGCVL
jgi:hypothetical protein